MEEGPYIEAKRLGTLIRKPLLANKSTFNAANKLVHVEDKNRTSLFNSWKSKTINRFN
tara:strand:+ start:284 stop:457 length:174 start_codon:yes stop_codon:yes gene_type:complete